MSFEDAGWLKKRDEKTQPCNPVIFIFLVILLVITCIALFSK